ncbi:MAG: SMP-30/gluconolactonase/LRE family protein [Kiritimatiellaeota bacterium]|nr:SMP-30/gluconolactonase/LRE family protein [Kiritimatiellota bacterium]
MNVELIADTTCHTGEGPLWHPVERAAYWTDITNGLLYRYDPATGGHACVMRDRPIGGFTLQADGSLLLFRDKGNIVVWRGGKIERTVVESMPGHESTRFNDVCANHVGGVHCGTMHGHLYYLAPNGKIKLVRDGYGCPNGMGFTPDNKWMYYNDSNPGRTYRWAYDIATGAISNDTVFNEAKTTGHPGAPDGMCVDAEGFLWIARWGGRGVLRHSPKDGSVVAKIDIPAICVSSVCFGGDALDTMYVTTAGGHERAAKNDPHAGAFFRVTNSGFKGLARPVSRVQII